MASLFFSYTHVDEALRDKLEVHLASLRRQGVITAWHDRRIIAGSEIDNEIDENLNAADVILLLVSPDFIASDYCYEREMKRAMERHEAREAQVIPVILRPCDWRDLPFGKLLGVPKDGKPVTRWPDIDEAFLDIETAIKRAVKELGQAGNGSTSRRPAAAPSPRPNAAPNAPTLPRSSNLRVRKQFTELDLDSFRQEGFEFIAKFFENSMKELVERNPRIEQRFQRVDAHTFTAAVYRNGEKVCKGSASLSAGVMGGDAIQYVMTDSPGRGGMNEAVFVKADDQSLYFETLGMQSHGSRDKGKLTAQGAAEHFWELFIQPLQ
jgi:hypothetical protein